MPTKTYTIEELCKLLGKSERCPDCSGNVEIGICNEGKEDYLGGWCWMCGKEVKILSIGDKLPSEECENCGHLEITYLSQPPKRYTFEQPKLKAWVEQKCKGKVLNLFSGKTKLDVDEFRVDIDKDMPADFYGDAFEFASTTIMKFDTVILDPPWSIRKSREKYGGRMIGAFTKLKNIIPRVLTEGGRVITVGYSSTGMSASRGFTKVGLCIVCHSGDHDDSFAVIEEQGKDIEVVVEDLKLSSRTVRSIKLVETCKGCGADRTNEKEPCCPYAHFKPEQRVELVME